MWLAVQEDYEYHAGIRGTAEPKTPRHWRKRTRLLGQGAFGQLRVSPDDPLGIAEQGLSIAKDRLDHHGNASQDAGLTCKYLVAPFEVLDCQSVHSVSPPTGLVICCIDLEAGQLTHGRSLPEHGHGANLAGSYSLHSCSCMQSLGWLLQ